MDTAPDSFAKGLVGVVLDERYRLDALLGEGGMGAVFRAHHLAMDRKVAVKLLKPHLSSDEAALHRFAREARATLKVDSPHAVKVLDFGITPLRDYYMVLEYLDGRSVQHELEIDGAFAPARVVHIAVQSLHALAASHRRGLVHRDIKPDNVFLLQVDGDPDFAKLLDFGVAKLMEGTAVSSQSRLALTAAGMVFGTPEFMSPEQSCGQPLDGRSDLYSLAATMFVMLTGRALFEGRSAIEYLTHHARTPPPHLAAVRPELAAYPQLDAALQRCLDKHRERRPRDAEEMAALLAAIAPSLRQAPAATGAPSTATQLSGYFQVLPDDLAPRTIAARPAAMDPEPEPELELALPSRRGLFLAVIGLAVVAMLGVAIGVAMRGSHAVPPADAAAVAIVVHDAALLPTRPVVDAPPPSPDAAIARPIRVNAARSPAAEEHLRKAEEALGVGNTMKQMSEADLAMQANPHNARATYLYADALIKYGEVEKGCAHLHTLGKNQLALTRAHAAGCTN